MIDGCIDPINVFSAIRSLYIIIYQTTLRHNSMYNTLLYLSKASAA